MIRVSLFLSGRLVSKLGFEASEVVIGRDPSCDLVIDNLGVSRKHARLVHAEEGWFVEDMGSQNGVFVGGNRTKSHRLLAEDEFSIGKYTIAFEEVSTTAVAAGVEAAEAAVAAPDAPPATTTPVDAPLGDDRGDMTFALDPGDLQKILDKVHRPDVKKAVVGRLTRIKPKRPPMVVRLTRNHYMAGTAKTCDIRLRGWLTPRRAALFVTEGGRNLVVSLADSGKVKVNGKKVETRTLANGDTIKIGRNVFAYST
jgi:pSer/pThr/pTyr-binding forkhead associated (FHA) protein